MTRLLISVTPISDESLPGLLSRATRLNVLEDNLHILRSVHLLLNRPANVSLLPIDRLVHLASAFGCDPDRMAACGTPGVSGKHSGDVKFGSGVLPRVALELSKRRISPITLQNTDHHRRAWLLRTLPYCPVSLERLRSDCSDCGSELGWRYALGIGVCESCECIVAPSDQPCLPSEIADQYRLFADVISDDGEARAIALSRLPPAVAKLETRTFLKLCLSVGETCRPGSAGLDGQAVCDDGPQIIAETISRGIDFLVDWPDGFDRWAERESDLHVGSAEDLKAFRTKVRSLGVPALVGRAQAGFVRATVPTLFSHLGQAFAKPGSILTGRAASAASSLSAEELRRLRAAGEVRSRLLPCGTGRRARIQFAKDDLRRISTLLKSIVPARRIAWRAGLPHHAIEQFCCLGLLERESDEAVALLRDGLQITSSSDTAMMQTLRGIEHGPRPGDAVSIEVAARRIGDRMKPWGAVFQSLLSSELPFWLGEGPKLVRQICVRPRDLERFDGVHFNEKDYPDFAFELTVTQREAEGVLNASTLQVMALITRGRLVFADREHSTARVATSQSVLAIGREVISAGEIAQRLGVRPQTVPAVIANHDIAAAEHGWCRLQATAALF